MSFVDKLFGNKSEKEIKRIEKGEDSEQAQIEAFYAMKNTK